MFPFARTHFYTRSLNVNERVCEGAMTSTRTMHNMCYNKVVQNCFHQPFSGKPCCMCALSKSRARDRHGIRFGGGQPPPGKVTTAKPSFDPSPKLGLAVVTLVQPRAWGRARSSARRSWAATLRGGGRTRAAQPSGAPGEGDHRQTDVHPGIVPGASREHPGRWHRQVQQDVR